MMLWLLAGSLLRTVAEVPKAPHWAFQPVRDPSPPAVSHAAWCQTSVDRFILARLESRGIQPAPAAGRRALLRRVTFDLTGLPPTAEELESFITDPAPDAFQRRVDRLLDSPRYGEHWGRHWLDVVRYADTAGETADYPVPVAWRYRNYVIDAFNADKPYNEFLREQIAGDILARGGPRDRYAERVTATGFLAISRRFGFDSENYHHLTLQDTIDTLGQSVLGLTLGCARCHAHKFDPVSTPDYYALYGIFESTRYAFPGSEQKQKHRALVPLVPPAESAPRWREFEGRVAALTAELDRRKSSAPAAVLRSLDDFDGDFEMQAPAAGGSKGVLVAPWVYEGPNSVSSDAQSPFKNVHPGGRVGVSIAAGTHAYRIAQRLNGPRTRESGGKVYVNLDFRVATNTPSASNDHRFWIGSGPATPAVEVLISTDHIALRTGDHSEVLRQLVPNQWHNLRLTLDLGAGTVSGTVGRPGDEVNFGEHRLSTEWRGSLDFLAVDGTESKAGGLPAIAFDNLAIQETPIPPVSTTAPAFAGAGDSGDVRVLRQELETLLAEGPFELAYGVTEGTPRDARIQLRGEPDKPGDAVPRGFLKAIGGEPLPKTASGSGRLELAEWLVNPSNPLTARVIVNRIWQYHFGQGLVRTPNDFGLRGQPPTDPDLLDYLATRFVQSGWSIKALHRLILSSAVYQQASLASRPADPRLAVDSAEDCPVVATGFAARSPARSRTESVNADDYASFPRRRLGAEETRDAILFVTGELDPTPGHGHPFPAPTGWGFTQHGPFSAVYEGNRRSVYLMTQRIKRHPFLALFDGADPNASTAGRRTTTVPTQALFFLNDPFVHATAEHLAGRMIARGESAIPRIRTLYRTALVAHGKADPDRVAMAAFTRVLLGSNEFLTVD